MLATAPSLMAVQFHSQQPVAAQHLMHVEILALLKTLGTTCV